jgi:UDP-glucose 4-epimerase
MKYLVTGAGGFIGSHLVDTLLTYGHDVVGVDNFVTGQSRFLTNAMNHPNFKLIKIDIANGLEGLLIDALNDNIDMVFHFAANADIRFGPANPRKDLEQNTLATFNVLEAMRINGVQRIAFASTAAMYGEPKVFPTPENVELPTQTSLYGASKLACEAMIQAYCETYNFTSWIFRFVSVLGERYTHGHIYNFYQQLLTDEDNLFVFGDGHQLKSSVYIGDVIDGILTATSQSFEKVNTFNIGTDQAIELNKSIEVICDFMGVNPHIEYAGGVRGWIGDNPHTHLDISKLRALGWEPKYTIEEATEKTCEWLSKNKWVFEARKDL